MRMRCRLPIPRAGCVAGLLLLSALALCAGCRDGISTSIAARAAPNASPLTTASGECGRSGLPDCPLQGWMKATLQAYQRAADYDRLGQALAKLAKHAPRDYAGWQDIAARGAHAAQNRDGAALRQTCKDCHTLHRARYRRELRALPLW
jgi:hypothetical protein